MHYDKVKTCFWTFFFCLFANLFKVKNWKQSFILKYNALIQGLFHLPRPTNVVCGVKSVRHLSAVGISHLYEANVSLFKLAWRRMLGVWTWISLQQNCQRSEMLDQHSDTFLNVWIGSVRDAWTLFVKRPRDDERESDCLFLYRVTVSPRC